MTDIEILDDAKLIACFAQRGGLISDLRTLEAIRVALEKKAAGTLAPADLEAVGQAMNALAVDIRPVTLADLRSWDPFAPKPQTNGVREWFAENWAWAGLRASLLLGAMVLMFLAVIFSTWQQKASDVLARIAAEKTGRQNEIVESLVGIYRLDPQKYAAFEALDSGERKRLREQVRQARTLASEIRDDNQRFLDVMTSDWLGAEGEFRIASGAVEAAEPSRVASPAPVAESCASAVDQILRVKDGGAADFGQLVAEDAATLARIRCLIGVTGIERSASYNLQAAAIFDMKDRLKMFNVWVLPFIFGMLGATIYYLRVCSNPLRRDPPFILTMVRIFLGGFVGVAIAWFWAPDATGNYAVANLTIGALTASFLMGFGAETFFSIVERVLLVFGSAADNVVAKKS